MTAREIAILPLTSTGVVLIRRAGNAGGSTLAIPRGRIEQADQTAADLLKDQTNVETVPEAMDDHVVDGGVALYRARLAGRARPAGADGTETVVMDFADLEVGIAAGTITDLVTIVAWMRHRLIEGETTRRRRLPKPVSWTPERLSTLERLWRDGQTGGEIAKVLGVTRNAVMGRIHRLGLTGLGGKTPPGAVQDKRMRADILDEFQAAFGREPLRNRRGDVALMVALAAVRADRSPNLTARWAGVEPHDVMEILYAYHVRGLWRSDDPPPVRWSGEGRLLSMMVDAQIAYGIFIEQDID